MSSLDHTEQSHLKSKAEGIAESWVDHSSAIRHPSIPLSVTDEELREVTSHRTNREGAWAASSLGLGIWVLLTTAFHSSPIAEPTKPGDATGASLWFLCAMMMGAVALGVTGLIFALIDAQMARRREKPFGLDSCFVTLPNEAMRWVTLFRHEAEECLALDPSVELACLITDGSEQLRLWQGDILEAQQAGNTAEVVRIEEALRRAALDMTYLCLAQKQVRDRERTSYEEALGEGPVNLAAAARELETLDSTWPLLGGTNDEQTGDMRSPESARVQEDL